MSERPAQTALWESQVSVKALLHSAFMALPTSDLREVETTQALVQLLRTRSYEEIRQRMYDNPPGSAWWTACKTELDVRNGEQMAAALSAMSRVLERLRASTEHFEQLADTLYHTTNEISDQLKTNQDSARRLEVAVYVAIGITLVQLFNLVFEVFGRR